MIELIGALTFAWITGWAWYSLRRLEKGHRDTILFIIPVYFLCCGLPLLLDLVTGKPEYTWQPGFLAATRDRTTCLLYCLYAAAIPPFWYLTARIKRTAAGESSSEAISRRKKRIITWVLWILAISPVAALMLAPDPARYLSYGSVIYSQLEVGTETTFHSMLGALCMVSIFSIGAILLLQKRLMAWHIMVAFPFLLMADWLNGKRAIVALTILVLVYVLWDRKMIKRKHLIAALVIAVITLGVFSAIYQSAVRGGMGGGSFQDIYDSVRIDFGRDAAVKMTIFAELYPDELKILDYRGQSLVFYLTMYVPRDRWPDKPMPYSRYFTSAMLRLPPTMLGWGMTTSCLEEPIANFGWIGMLIGPLLISFICRAGDSRRSPIISLLTMLLGVLFLTVQFVSFAPLFYLWAVGLIYMRKKEKRTRTVKRLASSTAALNIPAHG